MRKRCLYMSCQHATSASLLNRLCSHAKPQQQLYDFLADISIKPAVYFGLKTLLHILGAMSVYWFRPDRKH